MQLCLLLAAVSALPLRGRPEGFAKPVELAEVSEHDAHAAKLESQRAEGHTVAGYVQSVRQRLETAAAAALRQVPALQQQSALQTILGEAGVLAICGLVWAFCCMGSERAFRRATKEDLKKGNFSPVGLFQCFQWQVTHVCEACLCYQFVWTETASKLGVFGIPFPALLAVVCTCIILSPVTAGVTLLLLLLARVYVRTTMRNQFGQQGTYGPAGDGVLDCCLHLCCCPCATAQEAEFVEHCDHHGLLNV